MEDLRIFDLQRFALHDGPGIRTTVFLKGCPLNCLWCHNPESKKTRPQLGFLEKNCTGCGKCGRVCPNGVHYFGENGIHEIRYDRCGACGKCVEVCPSRALKVFGRRVSCEEIMETVVRDADYYRRSKGGLTVSGGEPMLQFDSLKKLLRMARDKGIHVCLDTSGQAEKEQYLEIAPYVDLFLFDYKMTDPQLHKRYVGTDGRKIRENLEMLCRRGCDIYLRCPIIPGINDTKEHYRAIAELSRTYSCIRQVNLMTYHDMAKGKASQIGLQYALPDCKTVEAEEKKRIYEAVQREGCLRLAEP